jgi:predicted TIM-barrel fold metal-dependent hydrolase
MGRNDAHKMMAGPDAWRRLFEKKGYDQFKTNIGHFGGTTPDQSGHAWPDAFIELMKKNKNLYADTGNWDALMKPEYTPTLTALFNQNLGAGQKAWQRIMFGTDWFMLNMVPDWRKYARRIYTNLNQHIQDEAVLKAFFYDNARRFYKL